MDKRRNRSLWFVWLLWMTGLGMIRTRYEWGGWGVLLVAVILAAVGISRSDKRGINMFRRKAESGTGAGSSDAPVGPVAVEQEEAAHAGAVVRRCTLLAAGTKISGDVVVTGDCQVCGHITGTVTLSEGVLRVMQGGRIEGDIRAPSVMADGYIQGTCDADVVEILGNGHLEGICRSRQFSIIPGGVFTGQAERMTGGVGEAKDLPATVMDLPLRREGHIRSSAEKQTVPKEGAGEV